MADKIKMTIAAYDKNCGKFADKFMQYDPYVTHVMEFADFLEHGFSILDIGCGPGNIAKQLCEVKDLEITGIDLSAEMLELAKRNVPQGIFYLQDSRKANFPPESFDAVMLSFSIVHLEDEEAKSVLQNAVKWVRSGGYVYLSFMEGKPPGFETTSFSEQPLYFNYFQEVEIRELLGLQGMECIRSVRQDYPEPDGSTIKDVFLFLKKR
ncbi:class I SAM-dependent methyltransferase [Sporomusa malonica]|uniref:class I SAM-dependent methyltransferase n=1 Tax=Sporomusa malonica TaxID=112901 RepID=UPI001FE3B913|nr:class I SAM-dependent methyltransferase [Sporomusa malonica]